MEITANRKKRHWLWLPILLMILAGCEKNHVSDIQPEPEPERDEPLEQVEITVENPGNATGIRYVNLVEAQTYVYSDAFMTNEQDIDFMVFNSGSTGINFITPDNSAALGGFGQGQNVRDFWHAKNTGTFIRLPATGDESNDELFDSLTSARQLRETLAQLFGTITNIPGYVAADHGPGRVRRVEVGDLLLFSSSTRTVHAIIKITDIEPGNAGSVSFVAKMDRMDEKTVEESIPFPFGPGEAPVEFNSEFLGQNGAIYIDLATLEVYTEVEAEQNTSVIDLVIAEGNNSNTNFFTIDNNAGMSGFSTTWGNRVGGWTGHRNEGEMLRFERNPVVDEIFEQLGNRHGDLKKAYDFLGTKTTSAKRFTNVASNLNTETDEMILETIFFYSTDRDIYAAIQIIERIKHTASRGELTALVKIGVPGS